MRVTTWAEYGLLVAVHLARGGQDLPVPARDVAERERPPVDFVEQVLLRLRRARLVESRRGARGGYVLARLPSEWMELRNRVDAFLGGVSSADLVRPEAEVRELVQA